MIEIPEQFARDTIHRAGKAGRDWIDSLPTTIARICREWDLQVDGPVMHGYIGVVVPVKWNDQACALKVSWLDEHSREEFAALRAWNGRGAVRVIRGDATAGVMLMERLDSTRSLSSLKIEEAIDIAGGLHRRLAIAVPEGFRSQQTEVESMLEDLEGRWERLGRPFSRTILDRVIRLGNALCASSSKLLVDQDLHYDNVLAGQREPWLMIDPKVVVGDPEYGVAPLLWNRLEEIESNGGLEQNFRRLVQAGRLDLELSRACVLVRTVDYWLWALRVGFTEDPVRCARIVEWLAR